MKRIFEFGRFVQDKGNPEWNFRGASSETGLVAGFILSTDLFGTRRGAHGHPSR
jgi:hypothetical protein